MLILKKGRAIISPLLSLLRSYSSLLSISQIGHQWSDRSPRWMTSFYWFHHLSGRQSRSAEPSRPNLDSSLESRTIKKSWFLIGDWWKEANADVLKVDSLTASSQLSSCHFTHSFSGNRDLFSLKQRIEKALVLLWANTQAKNLIRL